MEQLRDAHITYDDFLLALRGELPLGALLQKVHAHVLARCATCRSWWDGDDPFPFGGAKSDDSEDATSSEDVERSIDALSTRRRLYREARMDFERLMKIPRDEWVEKVENARTRYRTRAFAQRLIRETKERVKEDPGLAHDIAAVVPVSLRWATKKDRPWAQALVFLSDALGANALRISGELVEARRLFARLALAPIPAGEEETGVEIDSLHASLYIAEGRYSKADLVLERIEAWHSSREDVEEVAKVAIMRGNLAQSSGNPGRSFDEHSKAAGVLEEEVSPFLYLTTVSGRVNALADLDRLADARSLLESHRNAYERHAGKYGAGLWKCLAGRLALQEDKLDEAKELLEDGRDALLALGRHQDAAMASLDLATVHAKAGAIIQVRELARDLVDIFKRLGVNRELMAALRLLVESERIEASTVTLIAELRRGLELRAATL